ncbi:dormancy-associated protein homolog 4-like [Apium graveolens]|uniref:dormancy-associated protein homolog 4-like n=1 Tax=Apium graveolens TaxID=4045 RepID=UPI003D79301E
MGFLHNLWDETLAGPAPESGRSKLRNNALSDRSSGRHALVNTPVSRSITMLRSDSVPSSPTTPTTPGSPFSPTSPNGEFKKLTRRKSTSEALQRPQPKSPTGYDWIVLSALDR